MKVQELKKIIKPLIKECLKEVLVEEGLVNTINEIKKTTLPLETIGGPNTQRNLEEFNKKYNPPQQKPQPTVNLNETKKKMLDAIGKSGFDAFAGTQPLQEDKEVKGSDPGVDISSLMGNKQVWKQTLDFMNGKKNK